MYVVLAYDVVDDRMRRRFHKRLQRYLVPVQKSVFEGELPPGKRDDVEALILRELDLEVDAIRMASLCQSCRGLTRTWGSSVELPDPRKPILIG